MPVPLPFWLDPANRAFVIIAVVSDLALILALILNLILPQLSSFPLPLTVFQS